jgi:hypothetical protein
MEEIQRLEDKVRIAAALVVLVFMLVLVGLFEKGAELLSKVWSGTRVSVHYFAAFSFESVSSFMRLPKVTRCSPSYVFRAHSMAMSSGS